jgi:hypothetical protein
MEITDTLNALLWMAQKQGKLVGWSQPEVVYDEGGKVSKVSWQYRTPQGVESNEMDAADFTRLASFSARQNKDNKPNALYTAYKGGIDPGFAATKVMRHATVMKGLNPISAIRRPPDTSHYPQINPVEEIQEQDHSMAIDMPVEDVTTKDELPW